MTTVERDAISGESTTGHVWDGIKELNTPLPKWWVYVFYATIVWSVGYWIVYPAWPSLSGYSRGLFGYSSRADYARQADAAAQARQIWTDRIRAGDIGTVAADRDLLNYAVAGGRAMFGENCAPCHGAGGQGAKGFPVLADDDWIWGGTLDAIAATVRFGIRSGHADARVSDMPRFGLDGVLDRAQVNDVAEYVYSLSGRAGEAAAAARGKAVFDDNCVACHGEEGRGMPEVGGPRLADGIWLHGGSKDDIRAQVNNPRQGVMPAWEGRLDPAAIRMLAIYVHSLGGGK